MMSGVVIIGAGECGVRAAFALREHGYKGELTLIGAEAALPYERPPLSKAGEIRLIRTAEAYSDNRIFEKLIERRTIVEAGRLADPSQNLKRLLAAT
jgi:3-phenylpropionate/trans-cinnamate dioxygenase ferredoxin reductase component